MIFKVYNLNKSLSQKIYNLRNKHQIINKKQFLKIYNLKSLFHIINKIKLLKILFE